MRFFWAWVMVWSLVNGATLSTYAVKPGDNLYSIARTHAMNINEVLKANNLSYGSLLKIGQKLKVFSYKKPTKTYTVQPGDSPLNLARRFHMPLLEMIRANQIDLRTHRLTVGEQLQLPVITQPKARLAKKNTPKSKTKSSKKFRVATNALANKIVRDAHRYLGIRYRWGGNSPRHGIDCSRFAQLVYKKQGVTLPRVSGEQYRYALRHGKRVSMRSAKKGDLIFFRTRHRRIGHVGIIIDPKKHLFQQSSSGAGHNNIRRYDIGSYRRRLRGIVHMNIIGRHLASRHTRHTAHRS